MSKLLNGSKTLRIVSKSGNTYACSCDVCNATPDSDIVNMNYNPNLGQVECRMCKLYDELGGYDRYKEFNSKVLEWINNGIKLAEFLNSGNVSRYNDILYHSEACVLDSSFFGDDGIYPINYPTKRVGFKNTIGLKIPKEFRIAGLKVNGRSGVTKRFGYGFMGFNTSPEELGYVIYCEHCHNYIVTKSIDTDFSKKSFECPICSNARKKLDKSISAKIEQSNGKQMLSNKKTPFETVERINEKVRPQIKEEVSTLMNEHKDKDVMFGGVTREKNKSSIYLHFICKVCGNKFSHKRKTNRTTGKLDFDLDCPYCKENSVLHIKGKFLTSHLGEVYNHLAVVAQDDEKMTCTLECINCHKKFSNLPLFDVIETKKYYCTCEPLIDKETRKIKQRGSTVTEICPYSDSDLCPNDECEFKYTDITRTVKDVLNEKIFCPYDKKLDMNTAFMDAMIKDDMGTAFIRKGQLLDKNFKGRIDSRMSTKLRVEQAAIYVGTDGKPYHRCMCMECRSMLTLNIDEISSFNHGSLCIDSRQGFVRDINFKKIKF